MLFDNKKESPLFLIKQVPLIANTDHFKIYLKSSLKPSSKLLAMIHAFGAIFVNNLSNENNRITRYGFGIIPTIKKMEIG